MIRKQHYGAIYIPCQFQAVVNDAAIGFARAAGGVTMEKVDGAWVLSNGELCCEPVTKISVWFDAGGEEGRRILRIRNAAIRALWAAGEEAVATEGMSPGCDHELIIYTDEEDL